MELDNIKYILNNIPIFWINLDGTGQPKQRQRTAQRRRKILLDKFNKYELNHTRVEAIEGNNLDIEEYKKNYTINEKMNKFEVACTLSHLKAIELCYNQNLEFALILEDDTNFDYFKYKKKPIIELVKELKILKGDCIQVGWTGGKKIFSKISQSKKELIRENASGTQAYLITRKGMKKILDYFKLSKKIEVADILVYKKLDNYLVKPYFSYPFLKENGRSVNFSLIRSNTKGAHAVQTLSKIRWDNYYNNLDM